MPDQLVRIRVSGDPEVVAHVANLLRVLLAVAEESPNYPNRRDPGVRRYLSAMVPQEGVRDGDWGHLPRPGGEAMKVTRGSDERPIPEAER
jgi:hypothetical protein